MQESGFPFELPPRRRRRAVSWWLSLILAVAVVALVGTFLVRTVLHTSGVSGTVVDAYTMTPIAGATVNAGQYQDATDSNGKFSIGHKVASVSVEKGGYDEAEVTLSPGSDEVHVAIRPNVVHGHVVSTVQRTPVVGARVEVTLSSKLVDSTTTDDTGAFTLSNVPEGASIAVTASDFAPTTLALDRQTDVEVQVRPDVLIGVVDDVEGHPLAGAIVAVGDAYANSNADGTYRLNVSSQTGTAIFKASGYSELSKALVPDLHLSASLSPISVKALYASAQTASDPNTFNALVNSIDTTGANALVVDLKDSSGHVDYPSQVPLAHDIHAISPTLDPASLVTTLHSHHIYAIARIVVFDDPILAQARPDWAIHDSSSNGMWHSWDGVAWVNPYRSEVWDYNIAIAKEAAAFGFDEIQLDFVHFPSDGNLSTADYGVPNSSSAQASAMSAFLQQTYAAIAPTHAYLAADIDGLTLWETGSEGNGQNLEAMVKDLDYVCPMVYPSDFADGSLGFDDPGEHPYEVVLWSLAKRRAAYTWPGGEDPTVVARLLAGHRHRVRSGPGDEPAQCDE